LQSTSVVTVGFRAEQFLEEQGDVVSLPLGPARGELSELYDAVVQQFDRPTVAIIPRLWSEQAIRRLQTVQLASGRPPVAYYVTDAPPLAGGVLAALAAMLATRFEQAGVLLAALPAVERELIWVTWLRSIRRLRQPAPSLRQRSASLVSRRGFVVSSWPEPGVHVVRDRRPTPPLPELLAQFQLAVAPNGGDPEWARAVSAELAGVPTRQYEAAPLGPSWWGTEQLVETVAYPIDVEALAEHAGGPVVTAECRWCGERISSQACPFCGHALGPISPAPPDSAHDRPRVGVA
jgi:hypothetical protein